MRREFSAGGVLVRRLNGRWVVAAIRPGGRPEGIWALPKGRIDEGERGEQTALREVQEETGMRCRIGEELDPVNYEDRKGRDKVVRYWLMEPADDTDFVPNDEVDQLRWLAPPEAAEVLSYPHDRELVLEAAERLT